KRAHLRPVISVRTAARLRGRRLFFEPASAGAKAAGSMQKQFHPHVSGLLCRLANRVGSRYYPARAGRWTRPVRKKDDRDGRRRADDAARGKRLMRPERLARGLALLTLCLAGMGCEGIVDHLKANFAAKQ